MDNILAKQQDPKYTKLRLSNPKIKEGLNDSAISLLNDVGFEKQNLEVTNENMISFDNKPVLEPYLIVNPDPVNFEKMTILRNMIVPRINVFNTPR